MSNIKENFSLASFTTLHIGGPARFFVEVSSVEDIQKAVEFAKIPRPDLKNSKGLALGALPVFVLGGGSNVLISDEGFAGLVLKINIKKREVLRDDKNTITLKVGAGEVLDKVIGWTVENIWWGVENLSFVPGTIGGAIYMNAGCYGQEFSEVVRSVKAFDLVTHELKTFMKGDCSFTYRHSRFNAHDKGRFIVVETVLELNKTGNPNIKYADLEKWFQDKPEPSQKDVREALITIRTNKGQDPSKVWSAGSFFRNFKLTSGEFEVLLSKIKKECGDSLALELKVLVDKVKAPSDGDKIKVPAAFILDKMLGLKGFKVGGGMHSPMQVLNLVNTGDAKASDIIALYENAQKLVLEKTGLTLLPEPEFVGFE